MRAFIAIDLPEALHTALAEAQQAVGAPPKTHAGRRRRLLTLPSNSSAKFHAQIKQVVEALTQLVPFEPFTVEVRGFGFFPRRNDPVCSGRAMGPSDTGRLAAHIESKMERIGFARGVPFAPHLTLARFQVPRPQPALEVAISAREATSVGRFDASDFFLFESKLSPQGAQYRKMMRFPRRRR